MYQLRTRLTQKTVSGPIFLGKIAPILCSVVCLIHSWILPALALDRGVGLSAEVNVGGSLATGNTNTTRFDAEVKARLKAGRIEDNYRLAVEFGDDSGTTTAQRIIGSAESRLDVQDNLVVFGFLEYEDDRFSGFKHEFEGSLGAGYKVIDNQSMRFLLQAGPAYRISKLSGLNITNNEFGIRGSVDFEYKISETSTLANIATVTWDSSRSMLENTLSLTSELFGGLSTRFSYNVRHNSSPPTLTQKTDTLTKAVLVYAF